MFAATLLFTCLLVLIMSATSQECESDDRVFIATNWKSSIENPADADALVKSMNEMWTTLDPKIRDGVELSVHPPFVFIDRVRQGLTEAIAVGPQNSYDASFPNKGNTGATTSNMLSQLGCKWVLLGHSDRRNNLGETDALIADKAEKALANGLNVLLTLGELKEQRENDETMAVLEKQLGTVAASVAPEEWGRVVLAYEPVWAVGEGAVPCAPEEAQRIHTALREWISTNVSPAAGKACRITYTGSVNEKNAAGYAELEAVDGFVVGRAGLDTAKLSSIIETLVTAKTAGKA